MSECLECGFGNGLHRAGCSYSPSGSKALRKEIESLRAKVVELEGSQEIWKPIAGYEGLYEVSSLGNVRRLTTKNKQTNKLKEEPKSWEFRAKPAWQRLIVMMGGIIINVILGIIIFIFLTYTYGETYVTKDEVNKHGIYAFELGQELGLQTGDKIVKVKLEAGDLLIFNSTEPHGIRPNKSEDKIRIAQYISMMPAQEDDEALKTWRIHSWKNRIAPEGYAFPGDPRNWEQTKYDTAQLTELGEKLPGLRKW